MYTSGEGRYIESAPTNGRAQYRLRVASERGRTNRSVCFCVTGNLRRDVSRPVALFRPPRNHVVSPLPFSSSSSSSSTSSSSTYSASSSSSTFFFFLPPPLPIIHLFRSGAAQKASRRQMEFQIRGHIR